MPAPAPTWGKDPVVPTLRKLRAGPGTGPNRAMRGDGMLGQDRGNGAAVRTHVRPRGSEWLRVVPGTTFGEAVRAGST